LGENHDACKKQSYRASCLSNLQETQLSAKDDQCLEINLMECFEKAKSLLQVNHWNSFDKSYMRIMNKKGSTSA